MLFNVPLSQIGHDGDYCIHFINTLNLMSLDLSPVHTERVDALQSASTRVNASSQTNVKDSERSHRTRRVA